MVVSCIVVDDEPLALDILEDYIEKIPFLNLKAKFSSALDAMSYLKEEDVELVFLDIQMPDLTGIQFVKSLAYKPAVIFTTAYSNYAVEGFNLDATDYLLKPISFERFMKAANKFYDRYKAQDSQNAPLSQSDEKALDYLFIKTEYKIVKINLSDILYIEGLKDYIKILTPNEQFLTLQSMKAMQEYLPDKRFVRVHKSYILALKYIEAIERNKIKIKDKWIPIGNTYKEAFYALIEQQGKF